MARPMIKETGMASLLLENPYYILHLIIQPSVFQECCLTYSLFLFVTLRLLLKTVPFQPYFIIGWLYILTTLKIMGENLAIK